MTDLLTLHVARSLAWCERPCALFPIRDGDKGKDSWWRAQPIDKQEVYLYRASIALEAIDEFNAEARDVAAE